MSLLHELRVVEKCRVSPVIGNSDFDTIVVTAATSFDNFYELFTNYPRTAARFHPLLPLLPEKVILSVQVTLFPNYGIAISTTLYYTFVDGSNYTDFLKSWATISKLSETTALSHLPQLCFDRTLISVTRGMGGLFIKDIEDLKIETGSVLGRLTVTRCSPYALVCGLTCVSLVHARVEANGGEGVLLLIHGGISAAATYLGCLFLQLLRDMLRRDAEGAFEEVECWVRSMKECAEARALAVAGSPMLSLYEVDFEWGRPMKVELLSIEKTDLFAGRQWEEIKTHLSSQYDVI
ncbi:hypothetical protein HPP92_020582 [Vanilla planifolia]|uniref:Uncharacterized protein n=1 Tax=Vanilla planifolia TaxID=51239 RepID=A0A835UK84_VANPL|nr:hypothetical protein HPP92_020582 [Vanilla planifolia]